MTEKRRDFSGTLLQSSSAREIAHGQLARKIAARGIVLLKNEALLPFKKSEKISLLGAGAVKTVKGGIGSGDVNNRENISVYEGLKEAGVTLTSEKWLLDYCSVYEKARERWKEKILEDAKTVENPFDAYASNPFVLPEGREIEKADIEEADAAVYVISRISGEGKDRKREKGDYYLSEKEERDIMYLNRMGIRTALILNAGGPVELTDILEKAPCVKAVLNISQLGQQGGNAVADILLGKAVPEGKLTATWARRYEDYPYADTFSHLNGNLEYEEYKEGIYTGYRYFDSFDIKPLFHFGYGLSYTDFKIVCRDVRIETDKILADVEVTNIGDHYAGREVVQIYAGLPQTGEAREYRRLVGFEKTDLLKPGESQKLTVTIQQKNLAGFSVKDHSWMIEKGKYSIWVGNQSADLQLGAIITVGENVVLEENNVVCAPREKFEELGASEIARKNTEDVIRIAIEQSVPEIPFVPKREEKKVCNAHYADRQPVEDLIPLLYGNITKGTSTLGSAGTRVPGSAGETTEELEKKYGISSLIMADGPAGLRLRQSYEADKITGRIYGTGVFGSLENGFLEEKESHENADTYYQFCTAFPVGTAIAQTWDKKLMKQFGEAVAAEMEEFHVDLWLAPGMNIQRNPLCGRNFEYYSEDPVLSGTTAAFVTKGVQSRTGCGVTIKHFACNNQEDNRMGVDARVSEKALREIYFRGFEIAVKESEPVAIMTSYNLINGVHAANCKELCTTLAREEWGFDGLIMSDWNTTVPEDGSIPWKCAEAGNDVIMPGNPNDDENIREALKNGILTEQQVRQCAGRIIAVTERIKRTRDDK